MEAIQIVRDGKAWAIKHNGSFLGHAPTHGEATRMACALAAQVMESAAAAPDSTKAGTLREPSIA